MEEDLELLASIASGGLGRWVRDSQGRDVYARDTDCIGEGSMPAAPVQSPLCRRAATRTRARCALSPRARCALSPEACTVRPPTRRPRPAPRAACLRDLQRMLRGDDPRERPIFFASGKLNLARTDLVPLIVTYPDDYDVVFNARERSLQPRFERR